MCFPECAIRERKRTAEMSSDLKSAVFSTPLSWAYVRVFSERKIGILCLSDPLIAQKGSFINICLFSGVADQAS